MRERINAWKPIATNDCDLNDFIKSKAVELMGLGLKQMDASHIACAIFMKADVFLTTDKKVLNKTLHEIEVLNPIDFVRRYLDAE